MKLIAQIPGWSLYDRLSPNGGWISLKLVASGKLPKRHWWLGFNGTRMSRNRDAELLEQHQPEIQCMGHPGSVGSQRQSSGKRVTSMFDNPLRRKGFGWPQGGEEAFGLPSCLKRPKGTPRASLSQGEAPCQCSKSQRFQRGGDLRCTLAPSSSQFRRQSLNASDLGKLGDQIPLPTI